MKGNTKQAHAYDRVQPTLSRVRIDPSDTELIYWGILCRTCQELVAFDIRPYVSFGAGAAGMKPGAIRCGHDHNHIYFPRDFHFCASAVVIANTVMQDNRDAYGAINPSSPGSTSIRSGVDGYRT
jgi:hypothetical protein